MEDKSREIRKHTHRAVGGHADQNSMAFNIRKLLTNFIDVGIFLLQDAEKVSVDIIKYCY